MFGMATAGAEDPPGRTALDDYLARPDPAYGWEVVRRGESAGLRLLVLDMVSQHWLTEAEVDRPEWRHWLTLWIPAELRSDAALLYISGGRNGGPAPEADSGGRMATIAKATGTVVAELRMVPNQPLVFHGDGVARGEDNLIGYAWAQYLETGEARWLPRNAMVKSAVRAMDTVTAALAGEAGGGQRVDRFVVAGGSKRGWTAWLAGLDERVIGIIPVVIDVLNVDASMRHHFAAYGFWAPSIGDYVAHGIMQRMDHPRWPEILRLVDPYSYRHRLTVPKLVLNAAGDQFFLPDSSRFYWRDLRGEKYLRYVPNGDHGLGGTDAMETIIAFHTLLSQGRRPPQFSWLRDPDGTLRVRAEDRPQEVRLWQAHNPRARDFRVETLGRAYTSTPLAPAADGLYVAKVPAPERGWTAWFVELSYDVGAATPLKLSTDVAVTPDALPFADKAPTLPTSITALCEPADADHARRVAEMLGGLAERPGFAADGVAIRMLGAKLYANWTPAGDMYLGYAAASRALREAGCANAGAQFESGPGATLPPLGAD